MMFDFLNYERVRMIPPGIHSMLLGFYVPYAVPKLCPAREQPPKLLNRVKI